MCYWCYWGWPKPIRDIYDDCVEQLGGDKAALEYGPAHVVWGDENWLAAQSCLDGFDNWEDHHKPSYDIIRESLERLIATPDEFKVEPNGYDEAKHLPSDFPPPKYWDCEAR